jgi:hypothetical protein
VPAPVKALRSGNFHGDDILLWTIIHFRLLQLAVPKKPYRVAQDGAQENSGGDP